MALRTAAERLAKPQSAVVREAIFVKHGRRKEATRASGVGKALDSSNQFLKRPPTPSTAAVVDRRILDIGLTCLRGGRRST